MLNQGIPQKKLYAYVQNNLFQRKVVWVHVSAFPSVIFPDSVIVVLMVSTCPSLWSGVYIEI
jgi:hypothetical protein